MIKKVLYFLAGFSINIIIGVVYAWIYALLYPYPPTNNDIFFIIVLAIVFIGLEFILLRFFLKARREVASGMFIALLLPLLVVGYCSSLVFTWDGSM